MTKGLGMRKAILALLAAVTLSACATGQRPLQDMRSTTGGPDEFSVLPVGPLVMPETMTLPWTSPATGVHYEGDASKLSSHKWEDYANNDDLLEKWD